jgi:F-type H+-transporting ATPase subunit b
MGFLETPEFWVGVSFFGFVGVLIYFNVPRVIAAALDKRAETIRKELEEARRLRDEAQAILADYERKQRDAETEAQDIVRLARSEAEAYAEETRRALEESLARRTRLAEDKIARAEQQATAEVRAAAIEASVAAAEALIRRKLDEPTAAKLVDDGIQGLHGKLN